ncbi:MAG TPA: phosphoserine transaminase, partial [Actinomycetota bacterium]|nr:phosphoserine transaminase [Actinomycetota bacterium]
MKPSEIRIPPELLPSDGRFGSGPSKVRADAVRDLAAAAPGYLGTSHRQEGVRSVVRALREGLSDLFGLPDGYEVVLSNGGATAFWDTAVLALIQRRSRHFVFGEFSAKFAKAAAAAPHLEDPVVVEAEPGYRPEVGPAGDADVCALTHNETSTGVCMPVSRPDGSALVVVDGTSAAGGMDVDPREFDVYYFSPQKCFAADGGLWVAILSPAAVERVERLESSQRWIPASLSLGQALRDSRLDQTYNTPALATLFLFRHTVDWINSNGGLKWSASRCARSAEGLYGWADASNFAGPFVTRVQDRSPVVGTIDFDSRVDAKTVAAVLRSNGVVDVEPYRKLGRNQLRVGLYPAIEPDDVRRLTGCID